MKRATLKWFLKAEHYNENYKKEWAFLLNDDGNYRYSHIAFALDVLT